MWKHSLTSIWISSAAAVALLRIFNAADLGYDLTLQLQAAQNLLSGHGLSYFSVHGQDDLAQPNSLVTLTYFPAGYSLCAAGLLALGLNVGAVVKAIGAAATLLGWWGWGRLAHHFFSNGLERGRVWKMIGGAIAIITPLLYTPRWQGTDIVLWAARPWILEWVVKAADENFNRARWFDLAVGALCGFCVFTRYAGLFVAVYIGLVIVCQSNLSIKVAARRMPVFAAGLFPFLAVQGYLNYFVSSTQVRPGGLNIHHGVSAGFHMIQNAVSWITAVNFTVAWWLPHKILMALLQPIHAAPWVLVPTILVIISPLIFAWKKGFRNLPSSMRDIRVVAVGLFAAIPLLLLLCALFGAFYVGVTRYYWPLVPIAVLVAYGLGLKNHTRETKTQTFLRIGALVYLTGYLCMGALDTALLMAPGERGSWRRSQLMGTAAPFHWSPSKINYEFSPCRNYVLEHLKEEPATILLTNREQWFYADPAIDRFRLHRFELLRATHLTGPAKVLVVAAEPPFPVPDESLYWFRASGIPVEMRSLDNLPLKLIRRFPDENIKILEATIPTGSRIDVKRQEESVELGGV